MTQMAEPRPLVETDAIDDKNMILRRVSFIVLYVLGLFSILLKKMAATVEQITTRFACERHCRDYKELAIGSCHRGACAVDSRELDME